MIRGISGPCRVVTSGARGFRKPCPLVVGGIRESPTHQSPVGVAGVRKEGNCRLWVGGEPLPLRFVGGARREERETDEND